MLPAFQHLLCMMHAEVERAKALILQAEHTQLAEMQASQVSTFIIVPCFCMAFLRIES